MAAGPQITPAELLADGVYVPVGGEKVQLVMSNSAVMRLERHWGSLAALMEEVGKREHGRIVEAIVTVVHACAVDETIRRMSLEDVADMLDFEELKQYVDALGTMSQEASGQFAAKAGEPVQKRPFPGGHGGTSPSGRSASRRKPSSP